MIYSGILINCGGAGDDGFDGGFTVDRGPISISKTDRPNLYRTERYGVRSYLIEVDDGLYDVHLGFAETYSGIKKKGQRVFYVTVNGSPEIEVDPYGNAGGRNKAFVIGFRDVQAKDGGGIDIKFDGSWPMVNYIEVVRAGTLAGHNLPTPTPPGDDDNQPPPPPPPPPPQPSDGIVCPPEAARRGMTKLLFAEDFDDPKRIGMGAGLAPGQTFCQTSPGNIFNSKLDNPAGFTFKDSVMTCRPSNSDYQATFISTPKGGKGGFLLRGGGWYVEARLCFHGVYTMSKGFPALWSMDVSHLYGNVQGGYLEPDMFEWINGEVTALHNWVGPGKRVSAQYNRGRSFDPTKWFTCGALVEPDLSAYRWHRDGRITGSVSPSWMGMFRDFVGPVMFGSGPAAPFDIDYVRVWGKPA